MKSIFIESVTIIIKKPIECSETELRNFHELVIIGGKVSPINLLDRIKNCELLAFCYYENKIIATSSIKRPNEYYIKNLIEKAKLEREWTELNFEIGYSFTKEDFRKKGISKALKLNLIKAMEPGTGILFSTTATQSSKNFFNTNGFQQKGEPYDGDNDKEIMYYEIII